MTTYSSSVKSASRLRRTHGRAAALAVPSGASAAKSSDTPANARPGDKPAATADQSAGNEHTRQPAITLLTMSLLHRYYMARRSVSEE